MARSLVTGFAVCAVAGFAGCATIARGETPNLAQIEPPAITATFAPAAPDDAYRFFPGDEIEVLVRSAPELSRTVRVAPDGRIGLPMIVPVMAAERSQAELAAAVSQAYAAVLRDPQVDVMARGFGSQQVFVAGEVRNPGVLELSAPIDPFQAITSAGGFLTSAHVREVYIVRRTPGGPARIFRADLSSDAVAQGLNGIGPLQRFDVVYVPRSPIAEIGLFMQQYVREALPVNFSLFYDLRGENGR
jgi:polysaccharide export outer membrane protein